MKDNFLLSNITLCLTTISTTKSIPENCGNTFWHGATITQTGRCPFHLKPPPTHTWRLRTPKWMTHGHIKQERGETHKILPRKPHCEIIIPKECTGHFITTKNSHRGRCEVVSRGQEIPKRMFTIWGVLLRLFRMTWFTNYPCSLHRIW